MCLILEIRFVLICHAVQTSSITNGTIHRKTIFHWDPLLQPNRGYRAYLFAFPGNGIFALLSAKRYISHAIIRCVVLADRHPILVRCKKKTPKSSRKITLLTMHDCSRFSCSCICRGMPWSKAVPFEEITFQTPFPLWCLKLFARSGEPGCLHTGKLIVHVRLCSFPIECHAPVGVNEEQRTEDWQTHQRGWRKTDGKKGLPCAIFFFLLPIANGRNILYGCCLC